MTSRPRFQIRVLVALLATAAAASLALVGCGGSDDGDREASGTSGYVIDGNTGRAENNTTYRGVELSIENDFGADIEISFAGYCRRQISGTDGWRTLKQGEKARWKSCDKLIYKGYNDDQKTDEFSALRWPGLPGSDAREGFEVLNPAGALPKFWFATADCFNKGENGGELGPIGGMKEGAVVEVSNKPYDCGAKVVVKRDRDTKYYKHFYATVKPQG